MAAVATAISVEHLRAVGTAAGLDALGVAAAEPFALLHRDF